MLGGLVVRIGTVWVDDLHVTQLSGIGVGAAAAVGLLFVPYKALVQRAYLLYAFCLVLLVLVKIIGVERNGSRRWIEFLGFEFQPSELAKLALVVTLARFIRFRSSYKTFRGLGAPFVLTLVPMALILVQPDLGTALLCMPVLFTMLFAAGARTRHLATILLMGALAIFPVYRWGLKEYQRDRIDGFVAQLPFLPDRRTDVERAELERDELFQAMRARIAIGAGGFAGVDDEGQSEALKAVPERQNDFVFAVMAEEFGLAGVVHRFTAGGEDAPQRSGRRTGTGRALAPMPGKILNVLVQPGDTTAIGQPLAILEAMKMELTVTADVDGTVAAVHVACGDMVEGAQLLLEIRPAATA